MGASDCFVKRRQEREANHQKREAQKAEREANRQKREAQKAEREADLPMREAMKAEDAESVCSSSTMASCIDKVARVQARHKCSFCGAQQAEPKAKKGVNMCRDRCQSCFRPLTKQ